MNIKPTTGAATALHLLISGCSSPEPTSDDSAASPTTHSSEATTSETDSPAIATDLKGAVDIEGAYQNGTMSAKVGPLYRLDSGATVLALTVNVSPEITRGLATYSIGQTIASPDYPTQVAYSGLSLLTDSEVFLPLSAESAGGLWQPQDPNLKKTYMHPSEQKPEDRLKESVLIPFPQVDDSDQVGISVGLIGFAGNVPVVPIDEAPKNIQDVAQAMEPTLDLKNAVHSPYKAIVESPGLDVASGKESLEVALAADVFFDSGSWDLKPESNQALDQLAKALTTHEPGEVDIVGHTDDVPDNNVGNQVLSENRANAVKAALEQRPELKGFNFIASGKGETEPANPNHDEKARAQNRRVNIIVKTPVSKDALKIQAEHGPLPAPAGTEVTWPDSVEYNNQYGVGKGKPKIMDISASKAIAYPDYTVVTYTITSKTIAGTWRPSLFMENSNYIFRASGQITMFYGADIVRGETRTLPLTYLLPNSTGKDSHHFLTGGGVHAMFKVEEDDKITVPVVYPPTKDTTITVDAYDTGLPASDDTNGWRIKDIPVVQAQDEK